MDSIFSSQFLNISAIFKHWPQSASSIPTDTVFPVNLLVRPNSQLAENEAVCHDTRTIKKQKMQTNSRGEYTINQMDIAERSPGTICSSLMTVSDFLALSNYSI